MSTDPWTASLGDQFGVAVQINSHSPATAGQAHYDEITALPEPLTFATEPAMAVWRVLVPLLC